MSKLSDIIKEGRYIEVCSTDVDFDSVDLYLFTGCNIDHQGEYELLKIDNKYYKPVFGYDVRQNGDIEGVFVDYLGEEIKL